MQQSPTDIRHIRKVHGEFLDDDGPDMVRLSEAGATAISVSALQRIGYTREEAERISDQLIENALSGYRFAGLPRILAIARNPKHDLPREAPRIVRETPLSAMVDGGNTLGYLAVLHGTDIAIAKAKQSGMAIVGVFNTYFSGRNAYYAERIARQGLVAIHAAGTHPRVVPPGGRSATLGTNPFAIAFPSKRGPISYDIGTAAIMGGELELAADVGAELPEGAAFDAEGNPTRDARKVKAGGSIAPFGGHKGYGLSFVIQALGVLAGSKYARGDVIDYGFMLIAIDPAVLHGEEDFAEQISAFVAEVKATPRQPGIDEIRIPSERAHRERERRRKEGIVIEKTVLDLLAAL